MTVGFRPGYGLIREWSAQAAWQRDGSCLSCVHIISFWFVLQRHCSRFVVGSFIYGSSTGGCIQLGLQGQTSVLGVGVNADSVAFDTFMSAMMAG